MNLQSKYPSSEIVKDAKKIKEFTVDYRLYRNQVPVALFSGTLARLQANLEKNNDTVTPLEVALAATYITQVNSFYGDETHRQNAMSEIIDSALPVGSKGVWDRILKGFSFKPDGCWSMDTFIHIILEPTNSPDIGGDPILQCIVVLSKIIASSKVLSHINRKCAC